MANPRQYCWVVEVDDHEEMGKEGYIKTRLSGNVMSASNITFIYPSIYFTV